MREDASLAVSLPYALELARRAQESPRTEIRLSGGMLSAAVADFARLLREEFHSSGETPAQALDTWAADHGYDIVSARRGGPSRG